MSTPARDAVSVSVKAVFVDVAATPYDLHLQTALSCSFDGQGNNAVILIPMIMTSARSATITDIGADEFTGGGGGIGIWVGIQSGMT